MEWLPVRCAALACVIAGGVLMSGTGAVAFADDGTNQTGNTVDTTEPGGAPRTAGTAETPARAKWPSPLSTLGTPRIGPISPPEMNLPARLDATSARNGVDATGPITLPRLPNPRWVPVPVFEFDSAGQPPGGQPPSRRQSVDAVPNESPPAQGGSSAPQRTGSSLPTISLVPLVPRGLPMGPPVQIENPLPATLPTTLPIDLSKPLVPQILPPPVVMILTVLEGVPLLGLVISPIMNATVPPFIAQAVTAVLSKIVVPNVSASAFDPATSPSSSVSPAALPMSWPSAPPPLDIAPMGMDVPQAPTPEPPLPPIVDPPKLSKPASDVAPLGEQVEFRAGYSDYLRNAGTAQLTAIAVPGAAAILLFAVGGGFIGYRQARAGHVIRAEGIARFLR